MRADFVLVGDAAGELGISARRLSKFLYDHSEGGRCPVVHGRRLIPKSYLPALRLELNRRNLLNEEQQ